MLTPDQVQARKTGFIDDDYHLQKIKILYESGMTQAQIGKELGVSKAVIQYFMKKKNLETRNAKFKKGRSTELVGEKHPNWKGKDISYISAHQRVRNTRGKATSCSHCFTTEGSIDWANVSGKLYDPDDYISLCRKCHRAFDGVTRRQEIPCATCNKLFMCEPYRTKKYEANYCSKECSIESTRIIKDIYELRSLYLGGMSQTQLASHYKTCKTTITNTLFRNNIRKKPVANHG